LSSSVLRLFGGRMFLWFQHRPFDLSVGSPAALAVFTNINTTLLPSLSNFKDAVHTITTNKPQK
jgi:hypothetical protein